MEVASNALEALEKFRAGNFEVVITDRAMPGMSGDELARAIKELSPELPVIMITAFASATDDGQFPEAVDFVVPKPISLETLRNALARVTAMR